MRLGYITGSLWNGRQHPALDGRKLMIVRYLTAGLSPTEEYAVCTDAVGAGPGEWVITVSGSSARMTEITAETATDATIIGIVDRIDKR